VKKNCKHILEEGLGYTVKSNQASSYYMFLWYHKLPIDYVCKQFLSVAQKLLENEKDKFFEKKRKE